jgi:hypothetical protein
MFRRLHAWLIRIRDKRQLADKVKTLSKQDSLIYPWCDDQKN